MKKIIALAALVALSSSGAALAQQASTELNTLPFGIELMITSSSEVMKYGRCIAPVEVGGAGCRTYEILDKFSAEMSDGGKVVSIKFRSDKFPQNWVALGLVEGMLLDNFLGTIKSIGAESIRVIAKESYNGLDGRYDVYFSEGKYVYHASFPWGKKIQYVTVYPAY